MKTLQLLLITTFSTSFSFSQDDLTADAVLYSSLVGTWQHVSSTYPSGDVATYKREFQLFSDGKGICTNYADGDTVSINFEWEVKDSVISLFEIQKNGKRIYAESQNISFVDLNKMYLSDAYCEEQTGKICCYKRSGGEIAKY